MIHSDSEVFRLLASALRSAQYLRMRCAIARRFFGVRRRPSSPGFLVGAIFVDFAEGVDFFRLDDLATVAAGDGFRETALAAGRFVGGAISMPNISERSELASTFAPAGAFRCRARSEPALAIKSC